jgi:hypothetical protein
VLGTAGALGMRMAIFYAGVASARDPRATFEHQRSGHGAFEVTGEAAVSGPGPAPAGGAGPAAGSGAGERAVRS